MGKRVAWLLPHRLPTDLPDLPRPRAALPLSVSRLRLRWPAASESEAEPSVQLARRPRRGRSARPGLCLGLQSSTCLDMESVTSPPTARTVAMCRCSVTMARPASQKLKTQEQVYEYRRASDVVAGTQEAHLLLLTVCIGSRVQASETEAACSPPPGRPSCGEGGCQIPTDVDAWSPSSSMPPALRRS